jgi:hypothetical protein
MKALSSSETSVSYLPDYTVQHPRKQSFSCIVDVWEQDAEENIGHPWAVARPALLAC